jgi:hypothetical protein
MQAGLARVVSTTERPVCIVTIANGSIWADSFATFQKSKTRGEIFQQAGRHMQIGDARQAAM